MNNFGNLLMDWYEQNKRDLPWRTTSNPYHIWISEIILQQTQVSTGLAYFNRIIEKFPTVESMANSNVDELLNLWQGMGYYSRARNMHFAAKQIVNTYNGVFPKSHNDIVQLKGIGSYTAAAVASIAYGLPHAVVDGNVYRVLSRVFTIGTPIDSIEGKKEFHTIATSLLSNHNPGIYNQSIMELGALICKKANPLCHECPVAQHCLAYSNKTQNDYPIKSKKIEKRFRYLIYMLIDNGESFLISRREGKDIWESLFELPLIETQNQLSDDEVLEQIATITQSSKNIHIRSITKVRHILTHQVLNMTFVTITCSELENIQNYIPILIDDSRNYAFPKPIKTYLKESYPNVTH